MDPLNISKKNFFPRQLYFIFICSGFTLIYYQLWCRETVDLALKPCPRAVVKGMACIPGGEYIVGNNSEKWPDEKPKHRVLLSTFLIDIYEVTTAKYQECVKERNCSHARSNYKHMRGGQHPQIKVNWYQARDYCRFLGKRLPTEAEFEAASRGSEGETYPWGDQEADCSRAIIFTLLGRGCTEQFADIGSTQAVGSRPSNRFGLYDMAGNAHEWVHDWYEKSYTKCGENCMGKDPKGPCNGRDHCPGYAQKVVKGGSWYWNWEWARASKRRAYPPENSPPHHFGFRCVRSL